MSGEPGQGTPPAGDPNASGVQDQPFYSGFENADLKSWTEGEGWKSAEAMAQSAHHLEKMVGAPAESVLRVPQDGDAEAWAAVHQRLGTPATADAYEFHKADDVPVNEKYLSVMKEVFHKHGVSQKAAAAITQANNEFLQAHAKETQDAYEASVTAQQNELKTEWGQGYEKQMATAKGAAAKLGFTKPMVDALETELGFKGVMQFLAGLGPKVGIAEDTFEGGDGNPGFGNAQMTPAQAKAKWAELSGDPDNVKALTNKSHARHKVLMQQKADLFAIMYPEG